MSKDRDFVSKGSSRHKQVAEWVLEEIHNQGYTTIFKEMQYLLTRPTNENKKLAYQLLSKLLFRDLEYNIGAYLCYNYEKYGKVATMKALLPYLLRYNPHRETLQKALKGTPKETTIEKKLDNLTVKAIYNNEVVDAKIIKFKDRYGNTQIRLRYKGKFVKKADIEK